MTAPRPRDWTWKVDDPAANPQLALRYEPGTTGDLLKALWVRAAVAALAARGGPAPLRVVDPFAGAPTYPFQPATAARLEALPCAATRALLEAHRAGGRFPSTALVARDAARQAGLPWTLEVFDLAPERREAWRAAAASEPAIAVLPLARGEEALTPGGAARQAALLLVDPYDLFEAGDALLPAVVEALAPDAAALCYLLNKAPRGAGQHRCYLALRRRLDAARGRRPLLVGRVPSDAVLPRGYHEVLLVGPLAGEPALRAVLEERTRALAAAIAAEGAFEAGEPPPG